MCPVMSHYVMDGFDLACLKLTVPDLTHQHKYTHKYTYMPTYAEEGINILKHCDTLNGIQCWAPALPPPTPI